MRNRETEMNCLRNKTEMYIKCLSTGDRILRICCLVACVIFDVTTFVYTILAGESRYVWICVVTLFLIISPYVLEVFLKFKMCKPVFIIASFYSVMSVLGNCWKLYFITNWWDKAMHAIGGIIFALLAVQLFHIFCEIPAEKKKKIMCALFAFCFSIALSAVWEMAEYSTDRIFKTDMQTDTVISEFSSYLLGDEPGELKKVTDIEEVIVNDEKLPIEGYLDTGLTDTMIDMLVEACGALLVSAAYMISRKGLPLVVPLHMKSAEK